MFSIIYSMWNPSTEVINQHLVEYENYSEETRKQFEVIWVDDCSEKPVDIPELSFGLNLTIARITNNIYWNICGAKNLGFYLAEGPWVFGTEQDHMFYSEMDLKRVLKFPKQRDCAYFLTRVLPDGQSRGKNHPNSFIIHKEDFWKLGGYDEDFSGNRGHSDTMIKYQMKRMGYARPTLPMRIKEYKEFTCKDPRNRDFRHNASLTSRKMKEAKKGKYKVGPTLRFNWEITKRIEA